MIPKLQARGTSFKEASRYVLHDIGADTDERVGWAITQNLTSHPEDAWFEMFETAKAQGQLKAANGVDGRGRKNTKPVLHFSLSWDPSENPSPEHMQETAISCLKAIGLSEHEALIVGHTDTDHPHVHVVVNTVHPYTGRTADLKYTKQKMSHWAEAYERQHGIHCDQRLQNNDDRKVLGELRNREALDMLFGIARGEPPRDRAPYVPIKDHSPNRREWMAAKAARSHETIVADTLRRLTAKDSTFTRQDLAKIVSIQTKDKAAFDKLFASVEASPDLIRLPGQSGRLSTRAMVETESQMIAMATTMALATSHGVSPAAAKLLDGVSGLSLGQREALGHVLDSGQLASVVGYAGSGKSTMLNHAREVWEEAGHNVRGATIAGIAAEGLQNATGIRSSTIHALQYAWASGKEVLSPNTVVVIDEAGMVGSRLMHSLLSSVQKSGAKLVLVGDSEQLRPIDAGAAFRAIVEATGAATITEVRRQRIYWQQEATKKLATERTLDALQDYRESGAIIGHDLREQAVTAAVAGWANDTAKSGPRSAIMLSPTNAIVAALNLEARRITRDRGVLGKDMSFETWDEGLNRPRTTSQIQVAIGERLMFTKNSSRMGVKNGTMGTLMALSIDRALLRLDDPTKPAVEVDLSRYRNFVYGYALTLHKAQGATAERVHIVAGKSMDRNLTYVGLSRHRDSVALHYGRDDFPTSGSLNAVLSRKRTKDTTLDYNLRSRSDERVSIARDDGKSALVNAFTDKAAGVSKSDRIRKEMREWSKRNPGRDFGREM